MSEIYAGNFANSRHIVNSASGFKWEVAVGARDTFVFGPLAVHMTEEDMMRLTFAGFGAAAFGRSAEVCPKEAPPQIAAEETKPPDVQNPTQDCPLTKEGLKIPPYDIPGIKMPLSFVVWCKEAQVKLSFGLGEVKSENEMVKGGVAAVLSAKYRFGTDKSTVVYVGVEAEASAKTAAGSTTGVKGGTGIELEFNKLGQLSRTAGKFELSGGLESDVAEGHAGFSATIEKGGPTVEFDAGTSLKNPRATEE